MIFSCINMHLNAALTVQGVQIERTHEFKFLGVVIDKQLTWKLHIDHVKSSCVI